MSETTKRLLNPNASGAFLKCLINDTRHPALVKRMLNGGTIFYRSMPLNLGIVASPVWLIPSRLITLITVCQNIFISKHND
jgi:hypothetical protein